MTATRLFGCLWFRDSLCTEVSFLNWFSYSLTTTWADSRKIPVSHKSAAFLLKQQWSRPDGKKKLKEFIHPLILTFTLHDGLVSKTWIAHASPLYMIVYVFDSTSGKELFLWNVPTDWVCCWDKIYNILWVYGNWGTTSKRLKQGACQCV